MDFGVLSLDGLMGSDAGFSSLASDLETKAEMVRSSVPQAGEICWHL
jgi:hypothetical protein